jgi:hypothetical protein
MMNLLLLLIVLLKVFVDAKIELAKQEERSVFIDIKQPVAVRMVHIYSTNQVTARNTNERSDAYSQLDLRVQINEWRANLKQYDRLRRRIQI